MVKIGEAGFVLALREIVFLAALTGAETIYGIEDDTYQLSNEELEIEWDKVKEQLENKKYIEIEIDGSVTIDNDLFEMIIHCCQPNLFIKCNRRGIGGKSLSRSFYIREGIAVELDEDRLMKNTYALTPMPTLKKLMDNLKECYQVEEKYIEDTVSFQLSYSEFEEISTLIEESMEEEIMNILTSFELTEEMGIDFYRALKEKNKYILTTLLAINENEIAEMETFSIIAGEKYLWKTNRITSDEDDITFSISDVDTVMREADHLAGAIEKL